MEKEYKLIITTDEENIDEQALYVENCINNNFDNLKIKVNTKEGVNVHTLYLERNKSEEKEEPKAQKTLD